MTCKLNEMLVVSDMDGTLLTNNQELLPSTLATIRLFTLLGGNFTVATGRTLYSVERYPQLLPYLVPAITTGGTVIYDMQNKRVVATEVLPRAVAKTVVYDIMRVFPQVAVIVYINSQPYVTVSGPMSQKLFDDENLSYFARPFEELPENWNKVIFAAEPALLAEIERYVAQFHYPGVYFVMTSSIYFELMPQGISKGSALEKLCNVLHLDIKNTVAIGDYYNDLEMMERSGFSVAMQNAPADVLMQADYIAASNQEGGVGQFLYQLIQKHGGI